MQQHADLVAQNQALLARLEELMAVLEVVNSGGVDGLMVGPPGAQKLFTLKGADEPYRIFLETMGEGAATVDQHGNILYANAALAGLLRRPLLSLIGSSAQDLVAADDRARMEALLRPATAAAIAELRLSAGEGAAPVARITATRLNSGMPAGQTAMVFTDLTAQKQSEAEIRSLNANLEARVKQRTAALDDANRELEAFAYSVSHDLRAPLRSIDGFSLALLEDYEDKLDDEGKDSLRRVRAAAQRMGELIDAILSLSRATRGELEFDDVDLSRMAAAIVAELRRADPSRSVEVAVAEGIVGRADARLMRAALENLLSNAWKFTGRTPAARIEFAAQSKDGELVCRVRDNGAGFDMASAQDLFMPFRRLHRAADFPGNGIGLATVKRIMTRMGGRVWAEAAPGQGATFYFALPERSP